MRKFLLVVSIFMLFSPLTRAGELIDGIVARVNGHVILLSDWDDAVRFESFASARTVESFSPSDRQAVLGRLVDQELLREQIHQSDSVQAPPEVIDSKIAEIRSQYPEGGDEAEWTALLRRYHLNAADLRQRVITQIELMRLVDVRLRPNIKIDEKMIERYYNDHFRSGPQQQPAVTLASVSPQIQELLIQQKLGELLDSWLQTLRAGSQIENNFSPDASRTE